MEQGIVKKYFPNTLPPIHCFARLFIVSMVWGFGGCLDQQGRNHFDRFLRDHFKSHADFELPPEGSLYDYGLVKVLDQLEYSSWKDIAATQPAPAGGVVISPGYVSLAFLTSVRGLCDAARQSVEA